jgi:hypothetical protein
MKDPDDLDLTQGMGMFPSVEEMEALRQTALRGAPPKQWVADDGRGGPYPSEDDGEDYGKDDVRMSACQFGIFDANLPLRKWHATTSRPSQRLQVSGTMQRHIRV